MSRFIPRLEHLFKAEPQPMGFMLSRAKTESPRMQLAVCIKADLLDNIGNSLDAADAVLVEVNKAGDIETLEKICQAKDAVPGGGWLKSASAALLEKALKATCDFWVFPGTAPLSLTQKEKTGRVLEIDLELAEVLIRTANDLPVDAVLASIIKEDHDLTLNQLMQVQRLVYMVQKPILICVPSALSKPELQIFWDMGISAVVLQVSDAAAAGKLADLHQAIGELKAPAIRKKKRFGALLPRVQPESPQPPEEEEGDGEEDE